jgi:hypothetical protein
MGDFLFEGTTRGNAAASLEQPSGQLPDSPEIRDLLHVLNEPWNMPAPVQREVPVKVLDVVW